MFHSAAFCVCVNVPFTCCLVWTEIFNLASDCFCVRWLLWLRLHRFETLCILSSLYCMAQSSSNGMHSLNCSCSGAGYREWRCENWLQPRPTHQWTECGVCEYTTTEWITWWKQEEKVNGKNSMKTNDCFANWIVNRWRIHVGAAPIGDEGQMSRWARQNRWILCKAAIAVEEIYIGRMGILNELIKLSSLVASSYLCR